MALSNNEPNTFQIGDLTSLPMKGGVKIYEGAAVGVEAATGYSRPIVGASADLFAGFAQSAGPFDNTLGSDGAKECVVQHQGLIVLNVTGVVITSHQAPVYATDDNTFTLVSAAASKIGTVFKYISDGVAVVRFTAQPVT